jgi:hypothetical protein
MTHITQESGVDMPEHMCFFAACHDEVRCIFCVHEAAWNHFHSGEHCASQDAILLMTAAAAGATADPRAPASALQLLATSLY